MKCGYMTCYDRVESHRSSYIEEDQTHIRRDNEYIMHHFAQISRSLRKLCTIWHIFAEVSESFSSLGTYLQRSPNVVHLAHISRGLRKLCTTWHIFTEASKSCAPTTWNIFAGASDSCAPLYTY